MPQSSLEAPAGSVLTPGGWVAGRVVFEGERIRRIEGRLLGPGEGPQAPFVIPGFVDLHVHGGDGTDYAGSEADIRRFIRFHAAHGTVALAPTTATAPAAMIEGALAAIEAIRLERRAGEGRVLGAHLEGPFINPKKLGAQMDAALEGDAALADRWARMCRLVVATVAPEIPGGTAVVEALAAHGCRVQIGHSLCSAAQTAEAFAKGVRGFTHLFNAMSGVDHREPGVATYALAHGTHAEMICDLLHVNADVLLAARRAIPGLYAITDATAVAGRPDGEYDWVGRPVTKKGIRVTLADGKTLAGSAITMLDAFRNLASLGIPLAEVSAMCATRAADYLGLPDLGCIVPGAYASLAVLSAELELEGVWVEGERVR